MKRSAESPWKERIYSFIFFLISILVMIGWLTGLFCLAYWLVA